MRKAEVTYGNKNYYLDQEKDVEILVETVFEEIEKSTSINELNQILKKFDSKFIMSEKKYPKIEFSISKDELEKLSDFSLSDDDSIELKNDKVQGNTLAKLLYALAWKNGDLVKLKHIINGIKNETDIDDDKNDGLVFYQFGKYLTKAKGEPIVDQHVLRAFAISQRMKKTERIDYSTSQWQKMQLINKTNKFLITDYKEWLNTEISDSLKKETDSVYYIDKILFALGKTIKNK
jgi:hypothetical protein